MKVLHITKTFYPDSCGGVEEVVRHICIKAKSVNVQSDVITTSQKNTGVIDYQGIKVFVFKQDFELHSIPVSFSLLKAFRRLVEPYDVVHFHYPWPFMDLLNFLVKKRGVKKIVTYHCDAIGRHRMVELLYAPLRNLFLSSMDVIVPTSDNMVKTSPVLKKHKDKCHVIPLGISKELYPQPKQACVDDWSKKLPKSFVLFIGVLRHYKGLDYLIEAAKKVNGYVVIVGDGPLRSRVEDLINKQKVDNVVLLGFLADDDKMALLSLAKAVVLPSTLRSEAFGVCLLEGAMMSKPLISTELGTGTSYVNQDGETGFVVSPKDSKALALAINKLLRDSSLAEKLGQAAYRRYLNYFDADVVYQQYINLYKETVG
jgi:rhamnosyl/mannosyltransferase